VRRRAAGLTLFAGLTGMVVSQLNAPVTSPPLYDGVIVQEPYRYLAPQSGQTGSPSSYVGNQPVRGATSPVFVVATTESPPQAQLIAPGGAFFIAAGVTLDISIQPVAAPPPPTNGLVVGNLYRFAVTDPTGAALAINEATPPTVVLRAPDTALDATVARYQDGTWQDLPTQASGQPGIFVANVSMLGDLALIARPASGVLGIDPAIIAIGVGTIVVIAVAGFVIRSNRAERVPQSASRPPPPSKRRLGTRRRRGRR
jgi:hypothetical protein